MLYPPVNWHEGLFLQPHHFQAWDRHWSERLAASESWQNPHGYGLVEIAINSSALASGYFQLDTLKAKTPGGTMIELAAGQQSERRDVRPEFEQISSELARRHTENSSIATLTVYLGVPRLRLGAANVSHGEAEVEGQSRWSAELKEYPDETDSASIQPVELRRVNARILFSTEDLSGYDALAIAKVHRGADGIAVEIEPEYIPPLLDCTAWPGLQQGLLSTACELLMRTSEKLGTSIADEGPTLDPSSSIGLQRILALQVVNPAAATLAALRNMRGIHPRQVYFEFSRLAGALDSFTPQRYCETPPAYDHEDVGPVLEKLLQRIVRNLELLDAKPYTQKFFFGTANGMRVDLEPAAIEKSKRWILGALVNDGSPSWFIDLVTSAKLDWKLGSDRQIEQIFSRREPGVQTSALDSLPDYLPRNVGWAYFEIDPSSATWQDVIESRSLAIRFRDSIIANVAELPGNRRVHLKLDEFQPTLEFSLFALEQ